MNKLHHFTTETTIVTRCNRLLHSIWCCMSERFSMCLMRIATSNVCAKSIAGNNTSGDVEACQTSLQLENNRWGIK
eukprot:3502107-Amphidinium_carterae.1